MRNDDWKNYQVGFAPTRRQREKIFVISLIPTVIILALRNYLQVVQSYEQLLFTAVIAYLSFVAISYLTVYLRNRIVWSKHSPWFQRRGVRKVHRHRKRNIAVSVIIGSVIVSLFLVDWHSILNTVLNNPTLQYPKETVSKNVNETLKGLKPLVIKPLVIKPLVISKSLTQNATQEFSKSIKPAPQPSLSELRQVALADINHYRASNGVAPVALGSAKATQLYAEVLLKEGCIHHVDSGGEGPMLRYKNNGDTMFLVSENIAGGLGTNYGTPQSNILDGNNRMMYDDASSNWGHKRNMLDPQPVSVSIGIAYDSQRLVMVQDFETILPSGYEYDPSSFQTEPEDQKFCW